MKRLIKLAPDTKCYSEIDPIKLRRVCLNLLDFINAQVPKDKDSLGLWKKVVPLCDNAAKNLLKSPINFSDLPLSYELREGLLPDNFERIYAIFALTITGTPDGKLEVIDIEGELYAHVDFEDPV